MIRLNGKITEVKKFSGENMNGAYYGAECIIEETGVEDGKYKNKLTFTLMGKDSEGIKEGQLGSLEVRVGLKEINRKDGSGKFYVNDCAVPRGEGVWIPQEG